MMSFNKRDREWCVTLSAAKGLSARRKRCFAALSMTIPVLVVKIHHRAGVGRSRRGRAPPQRHEWRGYALHVTLMGRPLRALCWFLLLDGYADQAAPLRPGPIVVAPMRVA